MRAQQAGTANRLNPIFKQHLAMRAGRLAGSHLDRDVHVLANKIYGAKARDDPNPITGSSKRKFESREMRKRVANVAGTRRLSGVLSSLRLTRSVAKLMEFERRRDLPVYFAPASVSEFPSRPRLNNLTFRKLSRVEICRLTADGVTLKSSAARVKLPTRLATSKTYRGLSGGTVFDKNALNDKNSQVELF